MPSSEKEMYKSPQQVLLNSFYYLMRPLARMLLNNGIGCREFIQVCKRAFVDVATRDYGLRGRPTNTSRVAVMTGLTRKEVKKLKDEIRIPTDSITITKSIAPSQILHYWHTDERYLNEEGLPKELSFDDGSISFCSLAKEYGGDIPARALIKELIRGKSVKELPNGRYQTVGRYFCVQNIDARITTCIRYHLTAHASAILQNTTHEDRERRWLERTVFSTSLKPVAAKRFKALSKDHCGSLIEQLDDWISAHEAPKEEWGEIDSQRIGLGVYYFELPDNE